LFDNASTRASSKMIKLENKINPLALLHWVTQQMREGTKWMVVIHICTKGFLKDQNPAKKENYLRGEYEAHTPLYTRLPSIAVVANPRQVGHFWPTRFLQ
jgi:hypothetical protein